MLSQVFGAESRKYLQKKTAGTTKEHHFKKITRRRSRLQGNKEEIIDQCGFLVPKWCDESPAK